LSELVKENNVTLFLNGNCSTTELIGLKEALPLLNIVTCFRSLLTPKTIFERIVTRLIWELNKLLPSKDVEIFRNEFFTNPVRPRSDDACYSLGELFQNQTWDIVQVDFVDNADLALLIPSQLKKVLVVHDVRSSSVRQSLRLSNLSSDYIDYYSKVIQTAEMSYLRLFDGLVTFSKDDKYLLEQNIADVPILNLPFGIPESLLIKLPKQSKITQLIYIGGDSHSPNKDAILWYAQKFAETIFLTFGLELHVIGNWSRTSIESVYSCNSIKFVGFVDNLDFYSGNSIMIVTLRIGSGIRTKILEAFALGIPVISTRIGAEGIGAIHENQILIADSPEEVIQCLNKLADQDFRINLVNKARTFAEVNFSQSKTASNRMDFYKQIFSLNK
jgi:glycosyltransferase involved in cell wall biosynthesis